MLSDSYKKRSLVFKALAHPSRLFIIDKLAAGECCVCEFVNELKVDFSTVSKHLSVLKNAGLISDEKRGQQVFYQLQMHCVGEFNRCIDNFLGSKANDQKVCQKCFSAGETE
ncbi:MAG: ArsR/SmtB family transcription factor [Candidatus Rifleibacteriota bacterium]